ncbi:hypothetical protein Fmac_029710 [Flemingia macrophylla]|uniref:DUF7780 domain-containing protein n=1 Tax=Flemingia macrophylla TaxID=520843 RepID=A0ABD1LB42_9FABA
MNLNRVEVVAMEELQFSTNKTFWVSNSNGTDRESGERSICGRIYTKHSVMKMYYSSNVLGGGRKKGQCKAMQCKAMRKAESRSGMGMLLVLFPQDKDKDKDKDKFTFPSSNTLRSKAQSTISICAILLFTTLLLFTISTLPTAPPNRPIRIPIQAHRPPPPPHALQRMGILHRRGTKSMSDLTICHVPQDTPLHHFRLFLRLLHRSSLPASSDVVFLFPSPSQALKFSPIIRQENHAFNSLLNLHAHLNSTRWRQSPKSSFNPHRFHPHPHPQAQPQAQPQPIWGAKTPPPTNSSFTYGSILSFDAAELDPENSLAGFLPVLPLSLRRWACYPMLLARLRRHFKHLMLVDVTTLLILKDPLPRVRTRGPDHVLLFRDHHAKRLLPSILMGGARGLRRLSAALLLEIVRAATHHRKRKNNNSNNNALLVSESAVLTQLALGAATQFLLKSKNVDLILSAESIPELAVPAAASSDSAMLLRRANNHDLDYLIMAQICSSLLDSSVYTDCQRLIS